jgi:phosphoribosyl-AMP cyclohydrolase
MDRAREECTSLELDFGKLSSVIATGAKVVPVVVQNIDSGEVLVVAYANEVALQKTLERRKAVFWSTSRNELWIKGATSGDYLDLVEVRVNCEQNSLLYLVRPVGEGACHTRDATGKARSGCYYRRVDDNGEGLQFVPAEQ